MKIHLITNPPTDSGFQTEVRELMSHGGEASPQVLQASLRDHYPRSLIVRGIGDYDGERWYAYRDGSWTRSPTS